MSEATGGDKKLLRRVEGLDVTTLSLQPFEGFILSRIEGMTSASDLADLTGMPLEQIDVVLEKLVNAGAIEWTHAPATPGRSGIPPRQPTKTPTPSRGVVRTRPMPPGASRPLYDPAELEEDVELEHERRMQVLDTFYRLDEVDHYALLGIARTVDKGAIRDAYFSLSKVFHPDTLFGKNLGSYKHKMEVVFRRLTEAYEVLGKKKRREEYDQYLGVRDQTQAVEAALSSLTPVPQEDVAGPPPGASPSEPASSPPPPAAGSPRHSTVEERRRLAQGLLAKRLGAAASRWSSAPPKSPLPSSGPAPAGGRDEALKGLARSLHETAGVTGLGGVDRATRFVREAHAAEQAGDLLGAVNHLRLAVQMSPDREDYRAEHARVRTKLAASLADHYRKQATYEEENSRWAQAALSWSRVAEGRPDEAEALRRTARALLKAGGDLKKARDYAQRAVTLEPKSVPGRRLLAEVFVAADMKASARRELEEAAKLDPKDEIVKNLLRDLAK